MKKNVSLVLILTALGIWLFSVFVPYVIGRKPFKKLAAAEIQSAAVHLIPPDETVEIADIQELVEFLNDVVIYQKDDSFTEYSGQGVTFTLKMQDGIEKTVMAYNPFIVIDGVGYRCKYEPCQALNGYANGLLEENEAVAAKAEDRTDLENVETVEASAESEAIEQIEARAYTIDFQRVM